MQALTCTDKNILINPKYKSLSGIVSKLFNQFEQCVNQLDHNNNNEANDIAINYSKTIDSKGEFTSNQFLESKMVEFDLKVMNPGRNNQVFKVMIDSQPFCLKRYSDVNRQGYMRLNREYQFLNLCVDHGLNQTPKPVAYNLSNHLGLYTFVSGQPFSELMIQENHINAAVAFIRELSVIHTNSEFSPAQDACLSNMDHIHIVQERYNRLSEHKTNIAVIDEALSFVQREIYPKLLLEIKNVKKIIDKKDKSNLKLRFDNSRIIYSPSDFGFHNALVDHQKSVYFLDFEYAGRDDVIKLLVDTFCQPDYPIKKAYFNEFLTVFPEHMDRYHYLFNLFLPLHRIKWTLIILKPLFNLADSATYHNTIQDRNDHKWRDLLDRGKTYFYTPIIPI